MDVKKLFILLLISTFVGISLPQNLQIFSSPEIRETIKDMAFIDSLTGWIVCNKGLIYKTVDGTKTWTEQTSGTTSDFAKVFFLDPSNGWATTINGVIVKTTDGGVSWNSFNFASAAPSTIFSLCDAVKFIDQQTGFIIAGKTLRIFLLKTTDGGTSWKVKDSLISSTTKRWYDIDFNGSRGVIIGDKKDIQKYTTDGGETWKFSTTISDNFFYWLKHVRFLSPTDVIAIGEGNEFNGVILPVYKSSDAGVNWVKKSQSFASVYDRVKDAYFKNELDGIGVGSDGFSKAFLVKTSDGGETWTNEVLDYAFGLQTICGIGNTIYVLGTSSQIIYSHDFGRTWQISPKKTNSSIINFSFVDGKGIAATRNGDIYLNNDGSGKKWDYLANAGKNLSGAMVFTKNKNGFILKENHHIVKSTDLGTSWKTVLSPVKPYSRNLVGGIDFSDDKTGFAWFSQNDYGEYHVYKTSNEGNDWTELTSFAGPGYISGNVAAFDSTTVVLLGPDLWTERTTDGGVTWNPVTLIDFPVEFAKRDFEDLSKIDENRAIAIGEGFICKTTDKGSSWTYLNHGLNDIDSGFYKIAFSGDSIGYIALYSGDIIKTTDFGTTWTKNSTFFDQYFFFTAAINPKGRAFFGTSTGYILGEEPIVGLKNEMMNYDFKLHQNFPNPFNPSTQIVYQIGKESRVQLKIFDLLGREVVQLIDEVKPAGKYTVEFNVEKSPTNTLSSGIYFVQLHSDDLIRTIKISLLK